MKIEQIVRIEENKMKNEGMKVAPRARNDEQNMDKSCIVVYITSTEQYIAHGFIEVSHSAKLEVRLEITVE